MNRGHSLLLILVLALTTALTRFLPFLLFPDGRPIPSFLLRLGRALPPAVLAMLVVFTLKEVHLSSLAGFLPELLATALVIGLQVWKRKSLLSIGAGTLCYMLLVQYVF